MAAFFTVSRHLSARSKGLIVLALGSALGIAVGVMLLTASDPTGAPSAQTVSGASPTHETLWSADMEEADLSDWFYPATERGGPKGGGIYNSGSFEAVASNEHARSGQYSLRADIWTKPGEASAVRAFRWDEAQRHRELTFAVWLYIPEDYDLTAETRSGRYWNVFQFKSQNANGRSDPLWAVYIGKRPNGMPYLRVGWGWGGTDVAGPYERSTIGGKHYEQGIQDVPIGEWFEISARLRQSKDFDGRLTVFQDDVELFDFKNVRTSYAFADREQAWGANNQWSVNNYSDGLTGVPATIYIDDASISR